MSRIAVTTDSNSGITQAQAKAIGIRVIPMSFAIGSDDYLEDVSLSREAFFEAQAAGKDVVSSQAAPGALMEVWEDLLNDYDDIIHIPMSSAISGCCATAQAIAEDYDGRVHVLDNHRISVTQKQSVLQAKKLADESKSAQEIMDLLNKYAMDASIYIVVDTLKYLKKSGRVTPTAAALGTVLKVKPVLQIQGGKLDAFAKARGLKLAKEKIIHAIRDDMENRFAGQNVIIKGAYSSLTDEQAQDWINQLEAEFPGYKVALDPLSLNVCCHTGPGAVGAALMVTPDEIGDVDFEI